MSAQMFTSDSDILKSQIKTDLQQTIVDDIPDKYDLNKCVEWVETEGLERVCLQFPDHLLPDSTNIGIYLKKRLKKEVYILGDTSYGSCCIDDVAAKHIDADGIIHFGHACLSPTTRLPVFHVLPKDNINAARFCQEFCNHFKDQTEPIILFYDVSYAHSIESISEILMKDYKNLVITKLNCTSNIKFTDATSSNSVVLGRHYELKNNVELNSFQAVFVGLENRTLFDMSLTIPVAKWHLYNCESEKMEKVSFLNSQWLKRRRFLIEKLKDAKIVGIVVATLGIADYLKAIKYIKQTLKAVNKKSYILSVGKINPAKLANFSEMDAFVVIACPESEIFDSKDFLKPLLLPYEVDIAFNSGREFTAHHCMDFRQVLNGGISYVEFKGVSEETDVSLITGNLRNFTHDENDNSSTNEMNALTCKSTGTVAIGSSGASFLMERTWQGLEQRLGEDPVQQTIEKGRSGLPVSYNNETNLWMK